MVILTRVLRLPASSVPSPRPGARYPGWYEFEWSHVEESRKSWDPNLPVDLKVDTAEPLSTVRRLIGDYVAALR